ncbi:MAG: hypothetical protein ACK4SF_09985 [Algoriphagus aquaeductus]|uniref:hypothetical protein n=1 Tax=Algoriphagus aquaeductus TaxID=475299 RepID=UPI0039187E7D
MRLLIVLLLIGFSFPAISQESVSVDSLSKGEEKMLGIWKYDLPNQKREIPSGGNFQSNETGKAEEKRFWKKTESWICHLKENKTFLRAWVENGSLQEQEGTWVFDEVSRILTLRFEKEDLAYEVVFQENGQLWKPLKKEKEEFNLLFLKRLGS